MKHVLDDDLHQQGLDDTIESTFHASDAPSTIPDPKPDVEHTGERKQPIGDDESDAPHVYR